MKKRRWRDGWACVNCIAARLAQGFIASFSAFAYIFIARWYYLCDDYLCFRIYISPALRCPADLNSLALRLNRLIYLCFIRRLAGVCYCLVVRWAFVSCYGTNTRLISREIEPVHVAWVVRVETNKAHPIAVTKHRGMRDVCADRLHVHVYM